MLINFLVRQHSASRLLRQERFWSCILERNAGVNSAPHSIAVYYSTCPRTLSSFEAAVRFRHRISYARAPDTERRRVRTTTGNVDVARLRNRQLPRTRATDAAPARRRVRRRN